jgi:uncharacterized OB-fold protein
MATETTTQHFAVDFLAADAADQERIRLVGSRCADCGVALLRRRRRCENCASKNVADEVFARAGSIYSYTVQRYRPPGDPIGPDPWEPRPLAWIDIADDGPRVLGIVEADVDALAIDLPVELVAMPGWRDPDGSPAVGYAFRPTTHESEV